MCCHQTAAVIYCYGDFCLRVTQLQRLFLDHERGIIFSGREFGATSKSQQFTELPNKLIAHKNCQTAAISLDRTYFVVKLNDVFLYVTR